MRFKEFHEFKSNHKKIFEVIFEKYYKKGYFGDIDRTIIIEQQKKWFSLFYNILNEKDKNDLMDILCNSKNKITKEWFTELSGLDIKHKNKIDIENTIKEFVEG
jgi:hypothetical protein